MAHRLKRRSFMLGAGAAAAGCNLGIISRADASWRAEIHETDVISHLTHRYHGWPTIVQRSNGELLLVCSGGREAHVCPFGRVELMRSCDNGNTWSWPRVVMDGPIDDRDAGVVETAQGSLLITSFTSTAYAGRMPKDDVQRRKRWEAGLRRASEQQRQEALGVWMIRSTDGGVTWSGRFDCRINSPHGPIQLSDGRLLYAGKDLHRGGKVGACHSTDDGKTWHWLAEIPERNGDSFVEYHELHAVEAADGRIVAHIRNHNANNERETLQADSTDGGKTWSKPRSIGVWGLPSHLLRLKDKRLLMSYGHRRAPLGNQARVSIDHGRTWSDAIIISADGLSSDLGYPSTVELDDGTLLTVWYELMAGSSFAALRQARWSLHG